METKPPRKVALKRSQVIDLLREKPMTLQELHAELSFSHTRLREIIKYLKEHKVIKATVITARHFVFSLHPESEWECLPEFVEPRKARESRAKGCYKPKTQQGRLPQRVACYGIWGLQ